MKEFIQMVTGQFGIDESAARSATGGVLGFLKDRLGEGDFSALASKLPGATEMLGAAPAASSSGGGLLGGLMGKAASAMGGDLGSIAGLASQLQGAGLDMGQMSKFATMFVDFAKQHAGEELVDGLIAKIPELKQLVD